jgi:hypothetical protein
LFRLRSSRLHAIHNYVWRKISKTICFNRLSEPCFCNEELFQLSFIGKSVCQKFHNTGMPRLELISFKNINIIIWQLKTHNQTPKLFPVLKTKTQPQKLCLSFRMIYVSRLYGP